MKLRVGFDGETLGYYVIRDGRVAAVADTDAGRASLEQRLEMYARQMVTDHGRDEETITAEDVLKFIASRGQGRNWAHLEE